MNSFLQRRKGYSLPWFNLPNDPRSLNNLLVDLEKKVIKESIDLSRKLELIRTIIEVENKLKNYDKVIYWGNKFLELKPKDPDILTILALHYLNLKQYTEFLDSVNDLKQVFLQV